MTYWCFDISHYLYKCFVVFDMDIPSSWTSQNVKNRLGIPSIATSTPCWYAVIKSMCSCLCVSLLGVLFRNMCPCDRALTKLPRIAHCDLFIDYYHLLRGRILRVSYNFSLPRRVVIASGIVRVKLPNTDPSGSIVCIAVEWR